MSTGLPMRSSAFGLALASLTVLPVMSFTIASISGMLLPQVWSSLRHWATVILQPQSHPSVLARFMISACCFSLNCVRSSNGIFLYAVVSDSVCACGATTTASNTAAMDRIDSDFITGKLSPTCPGVTSLIPHKSSGPAISGDAPWARAWPG